MDELLHVDGELVKWHDFGLFMHHFFFTIITMVSQCVEYVMYF